MSQPKKRSTRVTILLVLLPVWLIGSGGAALWYYFHREKEQAAIEQQRFATQVSAPMLEDDLRKITGIIGERNPSTEATAAALSRTASMIEGVLGPSNTGYAVRKLHGPDKWPILQVTIRGKDAREPALWIVTSYDSPRGTKGAEANATGLAATLATAQALATDKPARAIHFAFLPHANDGESPVADTISKLAEAIKAAGPALALLSIEAMGSREELWVSPGGDANPAIPHLSGLGQPWEGDPANVDVKLREAGLPALRVSTRAAPPPVGTDDNKPPFGPTVAASTGRLIELVRRMATK